MIIAQQRMGLAVVVDLGETDNEGRGNDVDGDDEAVTDDVDLDGGIEAGSEQ